MARFEEIADDLRTRIRAGDYTDRLPGLGALAEEYDASIGTITRAEKRLADEGWIRIAQGERPFITDPPDEDPVAAAVSVLKQVRVLIDRAIAKLDHH